MSVEQMSTGAPAAAVERMSACISSLAPTSTPRVGSSSRNTDGCASSHLANTTFCWLPPDSEPASWSTERLWIRNPRTCSRARSRSAPARTTGPSAARPTDRI